MYRKKLPQKIQTTVLKCHLQWVNTILSLFDKDLFYTRDIHIYRTGYLWNAAAPWRLIVLGRILNNKCIVWYVDVTVHEHITSLYLHNQNFTAHRMVISDWAVLVTYRTYKVRKFGLTLKIRQNNIVVCN